MHYIGKNGLPEQIMFYRQQPRDMQHVPFDFEEQDQMRRSAIIDALVFGICAVGIVVLMALVYL